MIEARPDLAATASIAGLPPYIAEVVTAVAEGIQTSQEFAKVRGISISSASERFQMARRQIGCHPAAVAASGQEENKP
jgi:hypothetical protein